jgi:hypothetical protein
MPAGLECPPAAVPACPCAPLVPPCPPGTLGPAVPAPFAGTPGTPGTEAPALCAEPQPQATIPPSPLISTTICPSGSSAGTGSSPGFAGTGGPPAVLVPPASTGTPGTDGTLPHASAGTPGTAGTLPRDAIAAHHITTPPAARGCDRRSPSSRSPRSSEPSPSSEPRPSCVSSTSSATGTLCAQATNSNPRTQLPIDLMLPRSPWHSTAQTQLRPAHAQPRAHAAEQRRLQVPGRHPTQLSSYAEQGRERLDSAHSPRRIEQARHMFGAAGAAQ